MIMSGGWINRRTAITAEEKKFKRFLCVSLEYQARQVGVLPYRFFLDALWNREFTP
jgi:hypothetical protein